MHDWKLSGRNWKCIAPDHVHTEPDILDAATVWHTLGIIKTHIIKEIYPDLWECECKWQGYPGDNYFEHLDDAVFYTLRDIDNRI